jgi:membrane-bound lytic murein transglycosylase MltF
VASLGLTAVLTVATAAAQSVESVPVPLPPIAKERELPLTQKPFTGDFDQMFQRRLIRVLVPYSRTLYFNDKGREEGLTAELVRNFERYLNKRYAAKLHKRPLTVAIFPTTRDKLFPYLVKGVGDIAAGALTATPERLETLDFLAPEDRKTVSELVVTGPGAPAVASIEDLSGQTVHVRRSSPYYQNLDALNHQFEKDGRRLVELELVPDALEDEDLLEMVNAGLVKIVVVDDWIARTWAMVLPRIHVHDNVAVATGAYLGWAHRKNSPLLHGVLADYYRTTVEKEGMIEDLVAQFHGRIKQISNNTDTAEWKRFENTLTLFKKYGQRYGFDPLMLAAQGFQESGLNQNARSRFGAIGIMQILPDIGASLHVGDIRMADPNVHAGAKYMDSLMTKYFNGASLSEGDRELFAFASYNCGPSTVARMRRDAAERGLDPDKWFNNVEVVVAQRVGLQTTTYVRNIYKYYVAYRLQLVVLEEQEKARKEVVGRP